VLAASIANPEGCNAGYEPSADVPGWGSVEGRGGGEVVDPDCSACEALCTSLEACQSYECSPSSRQCNLNSQPGTSASEGVQYLDFFVCNKVASPTPSTYTSSYSFTSWTSSYSYSFTSWTYTEPWTSTYSTPSSTSQSTDSQIAPTQGTAAIVLAAAGGGAVVVVVVALCWCVRMQRRSKHGKPPARQDFSQLPTENAVELDQVHTAIPVAIPLNLNHPGQVQGFRSAGIQAIPVQMH
jgi:hypothetical protein